MDFIFDRFNPDENCVVESDSADKDTDIAQNNSLTQQKKPRRSKPKTASPSIFFENLTCAVSDNRLIGITDEIKDIDIVKMPIAATMLLRGLLESALDYQVRSVKKYGELHKYLFDKSGKSRDVGLSDLIRFCGNKKNNIFISPRVSDALMHSTFSIYKEQLDIIIHGKWAEANTDILLKAANALRPIISFILEGQPQEFHE
jgi:hypothetical protein